VGYDPNPLRVKDAPKTIPFLVGIFALAIAAESIVLLITVLPAISPNEVLSRFLSQHVVEDWASLALIIGGILGLWLYRSRKNPTSD
jgi:hypothetical protein